MDEKVEQELKDIHNLVNNKRVLYKKHGIYKEDSEYLIGLMQGYKWGIYFMLNDKRWSKTFREHMENADWGLLFNTENSKITGCSM